MNFINELRWRGLLQEVSDEAGITKVAAGTAFYVGFDPSAASLHFGSLVPLITAIRLGKHGLKPLLLFGGATGAIGDPSGKRTERLLLDRDTINANVQSMMAQARPMFERAGVPVEYVNNFDWTQGVSILEFLRDTGKHFTVNYMLAKDSVSARLNSETGISFTEFSYMLLQSFDFLHLYEKLGCKIQFGASDQWGNITAGLELIRRKAQGEAFGFCHPLLLNSQGQKMGKSESGAIYLDPKLCSPYRFHQYLLNVADADVVRLLKMLTLFSEHEIAKLEGEMKSAPEKRSAQKALADSLCTLVHGEDATLGAVRSAEVLFGGGSFSGLSDAELLDIFSEVPSTTTARSAVATLSFFDLLVQTGLSKSKGEAKRLVESGGAYLNNERIKDGAQLLSAVAAQESAMLVLRAGKKNYHVVKLTA